MPVERHERIAVLAALLIVSVGAPALAQVDASKPFICAITEAVDCGADGTCLRGSAEEVALPTFVWVDAPAKQLREHRGERKTTIGRQEQRDGRLLLQGVDEQERAWSLTVTEATGQLTGAAVDDGAGFVLFGACTRP